LSFDQLTKKLELFKVTELINEQSKVYMYSLLNVNMKVSLLKVFSKKQLKVKKKKCTWMKMKQM
jgi:hypothetical protein